MCGIVGGINTTNIVEVVLNGLNKLEYRGYDSLGLAVVSNNKLFRERSLDRIQDLIDKCKNSNIKGLVGMGHTRWATHGGVSIPNAHPHFSNDSIGVVHNGIIENYIEIKKELEEKGYKFVSETDTEVIVHLIHSYYVTSKNLLLAVKQAIKKLEGAYAIGVINKDNENEIICAKKGSPLVIGIGENANYFASDVSALISLTSNFIYLEDGDIASITLNDITIFDKNDQQVTRSTIVSNLKQNDIELGDYSSYMQKEIFEQPVAISNTLKELDRVFKDDDFNQKFSHIINSINRIQIISCGTSSFAGDLAKYWVEDISNIECNVEIASEYRYRNPVVKKDTLYITISQSGETADTISCIKFLKSKGIQNTLSICNTEESSIVRLSTLNILTKCGPEIGVASTKAFTSQAVVLLYLTYKMGEIKNNITNKIASEGIESLRVLSEKVKQIFPLEPQIQNFAEELKEKEHSLFLGRNFLYPIVKEGSLKLKEISYIHAESYPAGELKHGPLALVDDKMPVVVTISKHDLADKIKSNIQEVLSRDGKIFLITDHDDDINKNCYKTLKVNSDNMSKYLLPILYVVPLQLLAYHTANLKGCDVDKPRNLAKSVTVE